MNGLLLDTNILVDYLRNRDEAVAYLEGCEETLSISVLTITELYAGARNRKERQAIEFFIEAFETLPVTKEISIFGGSLRNK
jgi:predicted nucleic acid-binding protein